MANLNQTVTDPQNPGTPVAQATQDAAGVAFTATPGQKVVDAQVASSDPKLAQLELKLAQAELDRRKMQATFQSQAAKTQAQLEAQIQQYREKLDGIAKSKMDSTELAAYERDQLVLDNQRLKVQLQEREQALVQRQQVETYKSAFTELGIPADQLDDSNSEALANSGWQAMRTLILDLQAKVNGTSQNPAKSTPTQPHQPYTGQNSHPSTGATSFSDIKAAITNKLGRPVTDDEVWNLVEQGRVAAPEQL